jgi:hypothetical protein
MKIRYLILVSFLPKIINAVEPETARHEGRTEEQKKESLEKRLDTHSYTKIKPFNKARTRYTNKFKELQKSPDIQNLILDLNEPNKLQKRLQSMDETTLKKNLQETQSLLEKESSSNDKSTHLIKDLDTIKTMLKIQQSTNENQPQRSSKPLKPSESSDTLETEPKNESISLAEVRAKSLPEVRAKELAKKQQEARENAKKTGKSVELSLDQRPAEPKTPEEQLLNRYSLNITYKEISIAGKFEKIPVYSPSLANDSEANKLIANLKDLQKNPEANKTKINSTKQALIDHFTKLQELATKEFSDATHKKNGATRGTARSLKNFFADQIRDITDNPSYPDPKRDETKLVADQEKLKTESRRLATEIYRLKQDLKNDRSTDRNKTNEKITELTNELRPIKKELEKIDLDLKSLKVSHDTAESHSKDVPASEPRTTANDGKQSTTTEPKEKTVQEQINERRKEQQKNKETITTLRSELKQRQNAQSEAKSDEKRYNKLTTEITTLETKIADLLDKNATLEKEIEALHDNRDRLDNYEDDVNPAW